MKRRICHSLFIFFILIIAINTGFSQDTTIPEKDPYEPGPDEVAVDIKAGNFEFVKDEKKVIFSHDVVINYEDLRIEAPTVTAIFINEDTIDYFLAESSDEEPVRLYKEKEEFTAKSLKAYVKEEAYFLYELRGTYSAKNEKGKKNPLVMAADKSRSKIFDEKSVTEAHAGYLTTCDRVPPHYRFQANYIVVKESNEIIAYDLLMYVYDIPLLPYPVYFASLERKAQPVESSFTYTGEGGIQTHLRFNYYSKGDEIGSVFFDTVGDGDKKGNTIGAENKFTLPDGKTEVYFYALQKSGEAFEDRSHELKFDIKKKWDSGFEALYSLRNNQTRVDNEITKRDSNWEVGLKGPVGDSNFSFSTGVKEVRNNKEKTNKYVLPSFSVGKMTFGLFPEIYPVKLSLNKLNFNANTTTDASVSLSEALKTLNFNGGYGFSTDYSEVIIRDVKLLQGMNTKLNYAFKDPNNEAFKDDLFFNNTMQFPEIGFDWDEYFGLHTQYTNYLGFLEDWEDETAWRYAEHVKTSANINFVIWKNTLTHDYVFLKSDGNTSRFDKYTKEKNTLSYNTTLDVDWLFTTFGLSTSYDFNKEEDKLSNPKLTSKTKIDIIDTDLSLNTKSVINAKNLDFLSTEYKFGLNSQFVDNQTEFVYLYDKDVAVNKVIDNLDISFGPFNTLKKIGSTFDMVFEHDEEGDRLKLNKVTNNNYLTLEDIGPVRKFTEKLTLKIYPQTEEEKKIDYIKNEMGVTVVDLGGIDKITDSFEFEILPNNEEDERLNRIKNEFDVEIDGVKLSMDTEYKLKNKDLTFGFGLNISGFQTGINTTYDTTQSRFEKLDISLKKDLHCWENETGIEFGIDDDEFKLLKFTTSFSIKKFPEKFVKVRPLKKEFDLAIF